VNTFTCRFYFGNLTFTTLTISTDITAFDVVILMLKKLHINEAADQYAIYEYTKSCESI
jgi:hypothetical protein